jgi:regulator of replication initiation timing|tara:strand:+ start:325 stop:540 length:216 start_codon:yes stop_codon:yes gene_type:complete
MVKLSKTQEHLISEVYNLKKDFAIKLEEIQALYMEVKQQRNLVEKYQLENKHLKQQIKQLEQEQEEMLLYP